MRKVVFRLPYQYYDLDNQFGYYTDEIARWCNLDHDQILDILRNNKLTNRTGFKHVMYFEETTSIATKYLLDLDATATLLDFIENDLDRSLAFRSFIYRFQNLRRMHRTTYSIPRLATVSITVDQLFDQDKTRLSA